MRNFNGQTVMGYNQTDINAIPYLDKCPAPVKEGLMRSGSAFANVFADILVHDQTERFSGSAGAAIVELDNGGIAIDNNGTRFKVVTSRNDRFNVAPAFTKGYGRSDFGVSAKAYLSRYYDYVILANVSDKGAIKAKRLKVSDITDNVVKVVAD